MSVVVFDPAAFKSRYPAFDDVDDGLLGLYFSEATLYLNNTNASVVVDIPTRTILLYMLTAHIAFLAQRDAGMVGRVNTATEGSISVGSEFAPLLGSQAWFAQSQYGAAFWQATLRFREFMYVAPAGQASVKRLAFL